MQNRRSLISILAIIFYNLFPIAGVIFWDWSLFTVLLLYWLESGVIGFFNLIKIIMAQGSPAGNAGEPGSSAGQTPKLQAVLFFPFHYGIFWIVHGAFVFIYFGFGFMPGSAPGTMNGFAGFDAQYVAIAAIAMLINHAVTFFFVFVGDKEYLGITPHQQMMQPYSRVLVLHITILGGAWLITQAGTPFVALALLVVLKMAIDLGIQLRPSRPRSASVAEPMPQEPAAR